MSGAQKRSIIIIAIAVSLSIVILFYSAPLFKDQQYRVQQLFHAHDAAAPSKSSAPNSDLRPTEVPTTDVPAVDESDGKEVAEEEETAEEKPKDQDTSSNTLPSGDRTSRLHFLIPASKANLHFCYNLLSAAATRWPIPTILGWHGVGQFDAAVTHLAKIRAIDRYLQSLDPEDDDDLVVIIDGYDILMQLPPEIMIQRYFEVVERSDAALAKRFGVSVEEARSRGLRQTIFWGPDKVCWPMDDKAGRCWAVPHSTLPPDAFGPNTGKGVRDWNDPRWLNSGTAMGPINDMRTLINATLAEIEATYDPEYAHRESDQYYVSNVWARQEYYRSVQAANGKKPDGPSHRRIPEKLYDGQQTEFHVSIDYESALFQTRTGYERFHGSHHFNSLTFSARVEKDMFELGEDKVVPLDIPMPINVYAALERILASIPDVVDEGTTAAEWIRTIKLGVNYVTKNIYPLWHCTGPKDLMADAFSEMWWYHLAKPLLKASTKAHQSKELITKNAVDGRLWASKNVYPKDMDDELGGAWVDYNGATFVEWNEICGTYSEALFSGGEYSELMDDEAAARR
ncbi:hypothetical protein ACRE_027080 [Hapsidospora chrysogenum ATCC 11550]|uniref:Uncharacterized protein n=1 Tax=Hapsidospora chrysogenum (strain ATCC 11550 / CBS 779.69 / DSM 880 / IAM 14645 / JCM 23072 / IMI 49137) TaxID=857340 RepID=A0A086TAT7_HAPC1|nr:hypothetical protein ACRE_027080 [Hapsidospora chrysogenum ATCC 11550]